MIPTRYFDMGRCYNHRLKPPREIYGERALSLASVTFERFCLRLSDMKSKVAIRVAWPSDRDEWVRMRFALWPDCPQERHAMEIQQLTKNSDGGVVLVAVRENKSLCGFAEVSIRHDHVEGTSSVPVAYLEGWYVDPDMRN